MNSVQLRELLTWLFEESRKSEDEAQHLLKSGVFDIVAYSKVLERADVLREVHNRIVSTLSIAKQDGLE